MRFNLRTLLYVLLPVLAVAVANLLIEARVLANAPTGQFLFMKLNVAVNKGIIGGYFSDSAKPIFQIPMVTLGFFLLTLLFFIQLFAPIRSQAMRFAISLFFGGVFSNVLDRFVHGYVVDYIVVEFFGQPRAALNFADLVQYVGVVAIFVCQYLPGTFDDAFTDKIWVSRNFQKRYAFQLVVIGLFLMLVFGAFSYSFMNVAMQELSAVSQIRERLTHEFLVFFTSLAVTFLLFLFLIGKALSAYVARPILRFEDYLRNLSNGNYGIFEVEEPEFNYLEKLSDGVRDHLTGLQEEIQRLRARINVRQRK